MNLLSAINQYILFFVDTLREVGRVRLWLPLFVYALLQWLVLYAHYDFLQPPFYGIISAWVSLFGTDQANAFSHYPQHFLLLGRYAGWAKMLLGAVLEGLVLGWVAVLFHRRFTGEQLGLSTYRFWLATWLNLILAWIVLNGLLWAAGHYIPPLLAPFLTGPRRLLAFSYIFMPAVFTGIFAVFFTAIPLIVVHGENGLSALFHSIGLFFRRPFTLYGLALVILAVPVLLAALASRPEVIIDSFKPELVYWLLAVTLLVEMVASFFWMGTAVRFLSEVEAEVV